MATLNITIPDAQAPRILDAICTRNKYTGFLADGITAQTKSQFVKEWIISMIKHEVKLQETEVAAAATTTDIQNISIT